MPKRIMTTAGKIAVMQAYVDGKPIQFSNNSKNKEWTDWVISFEPTWDWVDYDFRIKPKEVKHKYKIGDYVLVLDGSNIPDYTGNWVMSAYVGKIYQIRELREWEGLPCYYLSGRTVPCFHFDERGLALVKDRRVKKWQ